MTVELEVLEVVVVTMNALPQEMEGAVVVRRDAVLMNVLLWYRIVDPKQMTMSLGQLGQLADLMEQVSGQDPGQDRQMLNLDSQNESNPSCVKSRVDLVQTMVFEIRYGFQTK